MQQTSIQLKTALLGLIFLASTMLKTGHLLLLHHDHHETPVCEIGHNDPGAHLHDERYNPDDCSICAFLFAVPELVQVYVSLKKQEMPSNGAVLASSTVVATPALHAIRLRGPPSQFRVSSFEWCRLGSLDICRIWVLTFVCVFFRQDLQDQQDIRRRSHLKLSCKSCTSCPKNNSCQNHVSDTAS